MKLPNKILIKKIRPENNKNQLKIFNSISKEKNVFVPIKNGFVSWYNCGPTVYDSAHMGHARNYLSIDLNRRLLENYFNYNVKFVQNVTDIDDKIILRARRQHLLEVYLAKISKICSNMTHKQTNITNKEHNISQNNEIITNLTSEKDIDIDKMLKMVIKTALSAWNLYANDKVNNNNKENCYDNLTYDNIESWGSKYRSDLIKESELDFYFKQLLLSKKAIESNSNNGNVHGKIENVKGDIVDKFVRENWEILSYKLDKDLENETNGINDISIFKKLSSYWENDFNFDMDNLQVLKPTIVTRVSNYIDKIVDFIKVLVKNGYAYHSHDGVYFDIKNYKENHHYPIFVPNFNINTNNTNNKNDDFALWKYGKKNEPSWNTDIGNGRPGWHIECSCMAVDNLGSLIDIHSGGIDLKFPHHENELAQSNAYFNSKKWVNYFLHTGHLNIKGQKMSKSLKNFITIKEFLKIYTPRQLRLLFALQQWNKPMDLTENVINEMLAYELYVDKFFSQLVAYISSLQDDSNIINNNVVNNRDLLEQFENSKKIIDASFCDNFSIPKALQEIRQLIKVTIPYINNSSHNDNVTIILIANYISEIFTILGLEPSHGSISWTTSINETRDKYLQLKDFFQFRDSIRRLSIEGKPINEFRDVCLRYDPKNLNIDNASLDYKDLYDSFHKTILKYIEEYRPNSDFLLLCDKTRNYDLLDRGIELVDSLKGPAKVRFISRNEQRELTKLRTKLLDKQKNKDSNNDGKRKKHENHKQNNDKSKINPEDMYKTTEYSQWDTEGIPTHYANGEPLSKSFRKKLTKTRRRLTKQ